MIFGKDIIVIFKIYLQWCRYSCLPSHCWLVPDFGGWSLDTYPDFGQYRHFWVTIIDLCTHRNPNKLGTHHYLRQRISDMGRFYIKYILVEVILVPQNASNIFCNYFFPRGLNYKKLVFSWTVWNFWYFTIIHFTVIFYA